LSKKEFIQRVIHAFEENAEFIPDQLTSKLNTIKEQLSGYSEEQVEKQTSQVVTSTDEHPYDPDKLSHLLYDAFPDMERMAKEAEMNQYELMQAVNQLRGELGLATDPPFPN
jgi:DNA anti-recombination protein RmuC